MPPVPVTIDANGTAHPDHAKPWPGDTVKWNGPNNFTINFKNNVDHPVTKSKPGGGFEAESKTWGESDKGKSYEYTIETIDAGGRPVIFDPYVDVQPQS